MTTKATTNRFFSSFAMNPDVTFESQREDEKVILMIRSHLITKWQCIFNAVLLVLAIFIFDLFFSNLVVLKQALMINVFSFVFVFSYLWFNFLHWFYNVGIITNERVVDVDFINVVYREINSARLEKIEDITSRGVGYFGSLFNYGNIFIQTAGAEINIEFKNVPNPSAIANTINNLLEKPHGHKSD